MYSVTDSCFMCLNNTNTKSVDDTITSQVKYLLPEIAIIKMGVPLRICLTCEENVNTFYKSKQEHVKDCQHETKMAVHCSTTSGKTALDSACAQDEEEEEINSASFEICIKKELNEYSSTEKDTKKNVDIAFDKFKQTCITNSCRLEESIKNKTENKVEETGHSFLEVYIKEDKIYETSEDSSEEDTIQEVKTNKNKKHCCTTCNKTFTQRYNLIQHIKTHTGEKDFHCLICGKQSTTKQQMMYHLQSHTGIKPFQCAICNKSYTRNEILKRHIQSHSGIKSVQCSICQKEFTNKTNLQYHMDSHTQSSTELKKYKCTICDKQFRRKQHLKGHIETHSNAKEFKCPVCSKLFLRKPYLRKHLKTHEEVKMFQCDVCDKMFPKKLLLMTHKKKHASEKQPRLVT